MAKTKVMIEEAQEMLLKDYRQRAFSSLRLVFPSTFLMSDTENGNRN